MVALVFLGMGMMQSFRVNGGGDAARANIAGGTSQSSLLLRALFGAGAFVDSASSSSSLLSQLFFVSKPSLFL
jgi:hypothetical protein